MVILAVIWLGLIFALVPPFVREARRTSWDLLETIVSVNVIGNLGAYAIYRTSIYYKNDPDRLSYIFGVGAGATAAGAFMMGGAIWVFRRLKAIGEHRRGHRIGYMLLGLYLFPSLILGLPCFFFIIELPAAGILGTALNVLTWSILSKLNQRAFGGRMIRYNRETGSFDFVD